MHQLRWTKLSVGLKCARSHRQGFLFLYNTVLQNLHQGFGNEEFCSLCSITFFVSDRQLLFPSLIIITSVCPTIVVWSTKAKSVHLIELTVPQEAIFGQIRRAGCQVLASRLEDQHLRSGCWMLGFGGVTRLLRDRGMSGRKLWKAMKDLTEE